MLRGQPALLDRKGCRVAGREEIIGPRNAAIGIDGDEPVVVARDPGDRASEQPRKRNDPVCRYLLGRHERQCLVSHGDRVATRPERDPGFLEQPRHRLARPGPEQGSRATPAGAPSASAPPGSTTTSTSTPGDCPEGQHLWPVEHDLERRVVRYPGKAHVCNACHVKDACTSSDEGREVVRSLEGWPRSDAGRFHRAISLALIVLAAFITAVAVARNHRLGDLVAFGAVASLLVGAGLRFAAPTRSWASEEAPPPGPGRGRPRQRTGPAARRPG
jgi:hypothetical protein